MTRTSSNTTGLLAADLIARLDALGCRVAMSNKRPTDNVETIREMRAKRDERWNSET